MKVLFAPGVLDEMEAEIEPKELQNLLDELARMAEDGSIIDRSSPVDLDALAIEDPELYQILVNKLLELDNFVEESTNKIVLH